MFKILQNLKQIFREILSHSFCSDIINQQSRIISTRFEKSFQVRDILSQPFLFHEENGAELVVNIITHFFSVLDQAYERRYSLTTKVDESQRHLNQSSRSSIAYSNKSEYYMMSLARHQASISLIAEYLYEANFTML